MALCNNYEYVSDVYQSAAYEALLDKFGFAFMLYLGKIHEDPAFANKTEFYKHMTAAGMCLIIDHQFSAEECILYVKSVRTATLSIPGIKKIR